MTVYWEPRCEGSFMPKEATCVEPMPPLPSPDPQPRSRPVHGVRKPRGVRRVRRLGRLRIFTLNGGGWQVHWNPRGITAESLA